jgi:hypothetical protein
MSGYQGTAGAAADDGDIGCARAHIGILPN